MLGDGSLAVLDLNAQSKELKIIERHAAGFDGLLGYVGTERIGSATVRSVIERINNETADLPLSAFCWHLGRELSGIWEKDSLETCLWVFIAGVEEGAPRFWFVVNGELAPSGLYVNVQEEFRVVNDLDMYAIPNAAAKLGVPVKDVLGHTTFFFRNGAIVPAAAVLDDFVPLVRNLYLGGYEGFPSISSIEAYAAVVRVRQEFVKRLFDRSKGVWRGEDKGPVGGDVDVYSVNLAGEVQPHHKHA